MVRFLLVLLALLAPEMAFAAGFENLGLTGTERGFIMLKEQSGDLIFIIAYGFVMAEEFTGLRKSKPVILAAGIIWGHAAVLAASIGVPTEDGV